MDPFSRGFVSERRLDPTHAHPPSMRSQLTDSKLEAYSAKGHLSHLTRESYHAPETGDPPSVEWDDKHHQRSSSTIPVYLDGLGVSTPLNPSAGSRTNPSVQNPSTGPQSGRQQVSRFASIFDKSHQNHGKKVAGPDMA